MERRFDAEGRLIIDWDAVKEAGRRGGPPTADDVTILGNGRRLDTAEKVRTFVAEFNAEQTRRRTRNPRRSRQPAQP